MTAAAALPRRAEGSASDAFLGVEQSATGRKWVDRLDEAGTRSALAIAQSQQLPELVARVLAGRGIRPEERAWVLSILPSAP